ncbi:hypothetical protein M0805_007870 [Coniferiporia weirii]|nr:hypothetical protein M0805_007870 [Coniferiporia weirii]
MGGSMSNMSPGIGGMGVHGIDISNNTITGAQTVTSSPLMLSGDESLLFQGPYATGSPHQHQHQHQPPTRPPSGSASSTTVSSTSSSAQGVGLSDALTDPSLVDPHVRYYFDSVMPMQYVFAADKAQGVLQNLFTLDPFGPLVNASCALAAKHNKAIRVARLLDPPDSDPLQSTAQQFFDRAQWQLTDALTRRPSMYAAVDALASLHLVAYFLMQGGSGAWQPHLDAARDWLAQTCLPGNEAPQRALATMDETEQLVARLTIWYDVFAGISLYQAPRFLTMYRRLLGGTISRESGEQGADMARFMGCPDDVLLILAETAALAQWKSFERQQGTLSNRELLKRGSIIENRLLVSTIAETTGGTPSAFFPRSAAVETHMHSTQPPSEHSMLPPTTFQPGQIMDAVEPRADTAGASGSTDAVSSGHSPNLLPLTMPATAPSPSSSVYTKKNDNSPVEVRSADARQRVAQVFLHTASLYLASIINEPSPGISEISSSVNAVMNALRNLPESITDRTLVLPLVIAGSLAELPEHYQFILARLGARDEAIGNVQSARLLIERVRAIRNAHGGSVDWRDVMREELHVDILLV